MKKIQLLAVLGLVATLGLLAVSLDSASAAAAIVIITDNQCGVADANLQPVLVNTTGRVVITRSAAGVIVADCSASGVYNPTGKALHLDYSNTGVECRLPDAQFNLVLTRDWTETLSASGEATIRCIYKP